MKAKIKATGEIVKVNRYSYGITNPEVYSITFLRNGNYEKIDNADEFEILPDEPEVPVIDWEQRRYEIAKDAMQAFIMHRGGSDNAYLDAENSVFLADIFINQLKNTPIK